MISLQSFLAPLKRTAFWSLMGLLAFAPLLARADPYAMTPEEAGQVPVIFLGLLIGVVLSAAAYLFFIWIFMRDRGQVFLLIFLVCIAANIVSINDTLMHALGIYDLAGRQLLTNISILSSWVFGLFFTYYFLDLDIHAPGYKTLFTLIGSSLLFALFYSLFNYTLVNFIMPIAGTIVLATILAAGLSTFREDISSSLVHIIAFTCFLGGVLAQPAYILGFLKTTAAEQNATYMAFAMSAMLFSIVVATQFAARQEEKEKALAVSNERFMLATKGANEGLFDWNLATGEIFFSDQFRKILGFRFSNDADGLKKWMRMMLPADRRAVADTIRRFRHNAKAGMLNVEYRVEKPNGERIWLHSKAVAMRDRVTQKVMRLVGSTGDITARKQGENALRASELRFRSITEAHPVPVLIVSLTSGTISYATPGSEMLLGIKQEDMHQELIERFVPDAAIRQRIAEDIGNKKPVDLIETEILRADGQRIAAAISARRITFQDEPAMVMGLYDLTERKKAETQIAEQQEALQQSEKMAALGGLLAGVAHELNNPLSVVVGQATLLMEGAPEAKVATRAEKIFKAADRCARIVKSFLALARRKPPERKPVALNQIVRSSLELLGYQLKNNEVIIETELDPALPDVTGDGDQLTQVVTNLVLNAAQAMEGWKGAHRITVTSLRDEADNVLLKIADTGPGIPAELRSRIFEPFFTTKSNQGGTGVGLALCINIVAAHGGELLLSDTPGGGVTFTIRLPPMGDAPEGEEDAQKEAAQELQPIRLLLVDDEVELAQTLADLLEPEGHQIDIAANGAIALEKLRKSPFDAIISDLRMPVMDGPALYEALADELPSYLDKIIYVTGDTLSEHVQEFLSSHTVPVVEKPYRLKDIRHALSDLLRNAADK